MAHKLWLHKCLHSHCCSIAHYIVCPFLSYLSVKINCYIILELGFSYPYRQLYVYIQAGTQGYIIHKVRPLETGHFFYDFCIVHRFIGYAKKVWVANKKPPKRCPIYREYRKWSLVNRIKFCFICYTVRALLVNPW